MNWIEQIALKRKAQRSNTFLLETFDYKRIEELKEILKSGKFGEICRSEYQNIFENDIETLDTTDIVRGTISNMVDIKTINDLLTTKPTVLIIKYIVLQGHADSIVNNLIAWTHDLRLYKHKSTVIVFTTNLNLFHESFRRLTYAISIEPSTINERNIILHKVSQDLTTLSEGKFKLDIPEEITQATSGLNLYDVESAAFESIIKYKKFELEAFAQYKCDILKNFGVVYTEPKRGFESVGGYQILKDYIEKRIIIPLKHPEVAEKYGLKSPRGIILYGFYGCGKSWTVKAFAKEIGYPMLELSSDQLLRGIVGESEARVRQMVQLMESLSPCIVFMDEFDALAKSRDNVITDSGVQRNVTNMLLRWLGDEARRSFVVGATNLLEQCDHAFLRTGRVDKIVLILPPDLEAREQILQVHSNIIRKVPLSKSVDMKELAKKTFMFTGAELEKLVLDAAYLAMDKQAKLVTQEDFLQALSNIEINSSVRMERINDMIRIARKQETIDLSFLNQAIKQFQNEGNYNSRLKGLIEQ